MHSPHNKDLTLVINHGNDEVDHPSIHVRWHFSQKVADELPTHILFIVYPLGAKETLSQLHDDVGTRSIVRIEDMETFLHLTKPGRHIIRAYTLTVELESSQRERGLKKALLRRLGTQYAYCIDPTEPVRDIEDIVIGFRFIAVTTLELNLPRELFSSLTRDGWLYKWLTFNDARPIDDCATRRRMLHAFTTKPLWHGFWWPIIGIYSVAAELILSCVAILLRMIAWFLGYKIGDSKRALFQQLFWNADYSESVDLPYGMHHINPASIKIRYDPHLPRKAVGHRFGGWTHKLFAPVDYVMMAIAGFSFWYVVAKLNSDGYTDILGLILPLILLLIGAVVVILGVRRSAEPLLEKYRSNTHTQSKEEHKVLLTNLSHNPNARPRRITHRLRMSKDALKRKWCKPIAY